MTVPYRFRTPLPAWLPLLGLLAVGTVPAAQAASCTPLASITPLAAPATGHLEHRDLNPYPFAAQQCTDVQKQANGSSQVYVQTTDALAYHQAKGWVCGGVPMALQGGPIRRATHANGTLFHGHSSTQPSGQWRGETLLQTDSLLLNWGSGSFWIDTDVLALPSRTTLYANGTRDTVVYAPREGIPTRMNGQAQHLPGAQWDCLVSQATAPLGRDRIRFEETPASSRDLTCSPYDTVEVPGLGTLNNNTWNSPAAPYWEQCLVSHGTGSDTQWGWRWSWPNVKAPNSSVYAYPELIVGAKPWSEGPGNDARFPRRVADTRQLRISYRVDTQSTGPYNTSTSIWLISTPQVPPVADPSIIQTEIMVWTETVGELNPGGRLRGEVTLAGRVWEVWVAEQWGDVGIPGGVVWSYVAYRAKVPTHDISFDAREFIADAVARGLASEESYIANVELGNEPAGGTGSLRLQRFTLDIQ